MPLIVRSSYRNHLDTLVCAVATHADHGLHMLMESCRRFGIGLTLFGWGESYGGHGWKLRTQRAALRELAGQYRYVLFLDAFDCIFMTGLEEIMATYLEQRTSILMSAEINRHPGDGPSFEQYPPAPTHYRYVNSGGFVGELDAVNDALERFDVPPYNRIEDDQGFWAWVYVSAKVDMKLDHETKIFQCLWIAEQDLEIDTDGRYFNHHTNNRPGVLHGNGYVDMRPHYRRFLGDPVVSAEEGQARLDQLRKLHLEPAAIGQRLAT